MHRQILLVNDGGVSIGENIAANTNDTGRIKLCSEIIWFWWLRDRKRYI